MEHKSTELNKRNELLIFENLFSAYAFKKLDLS